MPLAVWNAGMKGAIKHMTDQELLKLAIAKSGLSVRQFARQIVGREDRTIRRWIKGQPIPKAAKQWLEQYITQEVKK